jgi:hypothetical protein
MADPPINIHIHSTLSRRQRGQLAKAFEKGEQVAIIPAKAAPAKPGWQTTEFWITVLTAVGATAAAATDNLPPRYATLATTISVVAYALSRGLAKR